MTRPWLALLGFAAYLVLAFGLRSYLHWRRTGATGFLGLSGRPGSAAWLGGVGFVVALLGSGLAPVLVALGVDRPIVAPTRALDLAGLGLLVLGGLLLLWSQAAMGTSWRIGVSVEERTALVTGGPFAVVRNPIFSGLLSLAAGFALVLPTVVAIASFTALVVAIELQVRAVEEPYLRGVHGATYLAYTRRVGRFVPRLGRA